MSDAGKRLAFAMGFALTGGVGMMVAEGIGDWAAFFFYSYGLFCMGAFARDMAHEQEKA